MTRYLRFVLILALFLAGAVAARPVLAADARDYQLGVDDVLQIQVWQHPDLSGSYTVDSRGNIRLPLLGEITVKGRTSVDISAELQRRYSIVDPSITEVLVSVTGFNSLVVSVVGEVKNPGKLGFQKMPTVWEAVLAAGGFAATADQGRVQVVHREEVPGQERSVTVDLSRGLERTPAASLPALKPGDTILVPAATANAVIGDQVQILGAVKTPGLYPARTAASVMTALAVAGGTVSGATLNRVQLARRAGDQVSVYQLDVRKYLKEGTPDADLPLQPGDVLSVPGGEPGRGGAVVFQGIALLTTLTTLFLAVNRKN